MAEDRLYADCIQTFTGRPFWPLDPRPDDVDIVDIAHALSMQCRFLGHCKDFYSVAEHSVHVAHQLPPGPLQMWGLVHDAPEAYLYDFATPVKRKMPGYGDAEGVLMGVIKAKYGLRGEMPPEVHAADMAVFGAEIRQIMATPKFGWTYWPDPAPIKIMCWSPRQAKEAFMAAFSRLQLRGWI